MDVSRHAEQPHGRLLFPESRAGFDLSSRLKVNGSSSQTSHFSADLKPTSHVSEMQIELFPTKIESSPGSRTCLTDFTGSFRDQENP